MTTPEKKSRYPYATVATVILVIVLLTGAVALYTQFHHNYTEQKAACYKMKFVLSDTGSYENAKCTDPKTGILYDPEYIGAPPPY